MNGHVEQITELKGEYNLSVYSNSVEIYSTGWCSNTILSGGLINLYNTTVTNLINRLDFGNSSQLPGSLGYGLTGVIEVNPVFSNIVANTSNTFIENLSTQVYYTRFQTQPLSAENTLREFCVKSTTTGFSRNVFDQEVVVEADQYVIFEYRLKACRRVKDFSNIPFSTPSNNTFNIPVSSAIFNVPYPEVYKPGSILVLTENTEDLPNTYNIQWPNPIKFAVRNRAFSTFTSKELGRSINHSTRSYTVSTAFIGVSSAVTGVFNKINTLLLARPQDIYNTIIYSYDNFMATRLKFPLSLYRFPTQFFQSSDIYAYAPLINDQGASNQIDLFYNFTWAETTT
jgi:hypothetical protein